MKPCAVFAFGSTNTSYLLTTTTHPLPAATSRRPSTKRQERTEVVTSGRDGIPRLRTGQGCSTRGDPGPCRRQPPERRHEVIAFGEELVVGLEEPDDVLVVEGCHRGRATQPLGADPSTSVVAGD